MKNTINLTRGVTAMMMLLALLVLLVLPLAALAGGTATLATDGGTIQLAWQDDGAVRMDTQSQNSYMLMRDGKIYTVDMSAQPPRVMDMSGMMKMFSAMAGKSTQSQLPFGQIESVEATGESATVAGIEGRVYEITVTDADGQTKTKTAVLTDNPLVVSMTQAYVNSLLKAMAPDMADKLLAALPADDRGLLRSGDDEFRITAISDEEPAASVFALPAKPTSLGQMMQQMMQQQTQQ